jgi:eukaryotic-like serine/threonine-protein kinase
MELLEGRTLADSIGGRPLPIGTSLDLATHIASALDAAHGKAIVHRDIKPANIFVTTSGTAKVLDFGLAKTANAAAAASPDSDIIAQGSNLTGAGSTLGTIAYMSPKQARGQDLDGRSDLFSLGLVLYEMVTGRQAFSGETTAVVFDGILNRTPPAPSSLNPDVPPELERIIAKAIEKDSDARYQMAAELVHDLRALRRATESGATNLATVGPISAAGAPAWPSGPHAAEGSRSDPSRATLPPQGSRSDPTGDPQRSRSDPARWTRLIPAALAVVLIVAAVAAWQLRGPSQALGESDLILAEAERDYRAVLSGPSGGPYVFAVPLSHVGLARTLAAAGKTEEAREEYKKLLDEWKNADPDLEPVKELRAEFARLQT